MHHGRGDRLKWIVAVTVIAAALHTLAPAGPHAWHWVHLVSAKLYFVPILLGAAWFGLAGSLWAALAVSGLYGLHVARDWAALPMMQAEGISEIATFWTVGVLAGVLFTRVRRALHEVHVAHDETLSALASSLELRERYTAGHSRRVRGYSLLLAEAMGLHDPHFCEHLAMGAFLHDVGKIGIPDSLLLKPGFLAEDERRVMCTHPELGARLIGPIGFLSGARAAVRAHHERWDGQGYPNGLRGEGIPLAARLFAVVDTFDALTTDRPYHVGLTYEDAIAEILRHAGTQFDPAPADAFAHVPFERLVAVAAETGVTLRRDDAGTSANQGGGDGYDQLPSGVRVSLTQNPASPDRAARLPEAGSLSC